MNITTFALGDPVISSTAPVLNVNPIKPVTTTTAPTSTKTSIWDSITKGLDILKGASEVYSNVKPVKSSSGSGTILPTAPTDTTNTGGGNILTAKDNTSTYVLVGAGTLLAVGITAAIVMSKKKSK